MMTVLCLIAAVGVFFGSIAYWADRTPPCTHPEWVDLGEGTAVCALCDEVFQLEER